MFAMVLSLALWIPSENPADLAARAVSGDPESREEAAGRIEEIGRPALPALRIAVEKAENPAAARRLAELIDLIERRRLLRATPVEIDVKDAPLVETLADLGRKTGTRLVLDPSEKTAWSARRVSFSSGGPLAYWEAVDRLGETGGFRVGGGGYWFTGPPNVDPVVRLSRREGPPGRTSYAGPFRVDLVSLNRHREATQTRPGTPPKVRDEFVAVLQLLPEPGLEIDRNGSPRIVEAIDATGADLRPATTFDPSTPRPNIFRQWRSDNPSGLTYRVPLAIPAALGGTLTRLRGNLPITALARTEPLLTLPLDGAEGRPVAASGVTLMVRRIERQNGRVAAIQVLVRGEPTNLTPSVAPGPRQLTLGRLRPVYHADDHFQILDDQGRPHAIYSTSNLATARPDGSFEIRIQIHVSVALGPPTTLRYRGLIGEAIEVPFAFDDAPMP